MRYEIGQEIYAVSFYDTRHKLRGLHAVPSASLQSEATINHKFVKLTVVEHHKVALDQNPNGEKENDGFVLRDSEGKVYHNQYPVATYGVFTSKADHYFLRKLGESQTIEDLIGVEEACSYIDIERAYDFCFTMEQDSSAPEVKAFYTRRMDEMDAYLALHDKQMLRSPIWARFPDVLTFKIFPIQKG